MPLDYEYEPGEKRFKHKWNRDEAGFQPEGKNGRGQCPTSITNTTGLARQILRNGISYPPNTEPPDRIYNVHQGVVYRAEITEPGKSYHGFPESEATGGKVPGYVLEELADRADKKGEFRLFKKWAKSRLPEGWNNLRYKPRNG